jgi:hypothetical protein
MTHYHHRERKEFMGYTSLTCQSTGKICTGSASAKLLIISITLKRSGCENMNLQ